MKEYKEFDIYINVFEGGFDIDDVSDGVHDRNWPARVCNVSISEKQLKMIGETAGHMEEGGIQRAILDLLLRLVENHESKEKDNEEV